MFGSEFTAIAIACVRVEHKYYIGAEEVRIRGIAGEA